MQKFNLINLSTELVDAIVNHIDDPREILSAALTCKRIYQVTVPDHLEFRYIRCDPRQKDLWDGICQRPVLAAKVRFLEMRWTPRHGHGQDGQSSKDILPRSMRLVPVDDSSSPRNKMDFLSLVTAVERMESLVHFSWTGWMPQGIDHLFRAVDNGLSPLKELQISYEENGWPMGFDLFSEALPVGDPGKQNMHFVERLPSLRALAIAYPSRRGNTYLPTPFYEALATDTGLLLQDLLIDFMDWNAWLESSQMSLKCFLKTAHLYQLRRFTLCGYGTQSVKQELALFLSHHPKLEALWLGRLEPPNFKESNIILPNLKALQFQWAAFALEEAHALKNIPEEMFKGLKHLCVPLVNKTLSVLNNTPHLESCYLSAVSNISQLSTKVPLLQRLDLELPSNKRGKVHFEKCLKDLSNLTKLTHLSSLFADKQVSIRDPKVQKHLQNLANKLRDLKYVEICYYDDTSWITIDRDGNGDYSGFQDANLPVYKLKEWGTFFFGYR